MKTINLLPQKAGPSAAPSRIPVRLIAWAAAGLVAAAGAWYATGIPARQLAREVDLQNRRLAAARAGNDARAGRDKIQKRLEALIERRAEMESPLPTSAVLALASRLLPDTISLTRLSLEIAAPASELKAPAAAAKASSKPSAAMPFRLEFEGMAMSEVAVARSISRFSDHPLFTNVKLARSRQVQESGSPRTQFHITLQVPTNRQFQMPAEEVTANAH